MGLVDTPSPRSINMTVKPVCTDSKAIKIEGGLMD